MSCLWEEERVLIYSATYLVLLFSGIQYQIYILKCANNQHVCLFLSNASQKIKFICFAAAVMRKMVMAESQTGKISTEKVPLRFQNFLPPFLFF